MVLHEFLAKLRECVSHCEHVKKGKPGKVRKFDIGQGPGKSWSL